MYRLLPLARNIAGLSRSYADVAALKRVAKERIATVDENQPFSNALIDSYDRRHDYLRISLTERCNLRCFYCMPEEGVELTPSPQLLSNEEVLRLAELFVKSGVRKIRLTGGEPTIRKGILDIITGLNQLRQHGLESIAMTTNGIALHRRLPQYIEAGLTHLNLSLDTLDPFKFELMTKRRGHDAVLKTLDTALSSTELQTVKLNVVVVKGLNDHEVHDFVSLTQDSPLSWDKAKMIPSSTLLDRITARHPDVVRISDEINDTARSWKVPGFKGSFGFISSMSDHFCSSCNRLRITADGKIKVCLFDDKEVSLRDAMREGGTDGELLQIISRAVLGKQEKHVHMEDINFSRSRNTIPPVINAPLLGSRNHILDKHSKKKSAHLSPQVFNFRPTASRISALHSSTTSLNGNRLSHLDNSGRANMVDVSDKSVTKRSATAIGRIYIPPIAYELVTSSYPAEDSTTPDSGAKAKALRKGDALTVAQLAAIMGSKKTSDLIPLCHPLPLTKVAVTLTPEIQHDDSRATSHSIKCQATVTCEGKTGVEMEALTAVSVGLLTVWDMLKAVAGKEMMIGDIYVSEKSGGRNGNFSR
ncbi:hypothetical protein VNI00_002175 [Paramarasmius palmivorus]|uniref:Radical SAM core domain-containing protein n=1 Tax=Paramarasmius palmivorus TaxID=297713 RepID=A0AAW0E3N8_9AGAR